MRNIKILAAALALASVCSLATAQEFSEDFDSYTAGTALHGVGGWHGWDNAAAAGATASNKYAFNGKNSVEIGPGSDFVHDFTPKGGVWEFTAMQYIPSGLTGVQYFIMMNQYATARDWSVQVKFDLATGAITAEQPATPNSGKTIVFDKWVKIRLIIDLTANTVNMYYDGVKICSGVWDDSVHGTLEAIDLYGNNAAPIYYDDLQLAPYIESLPTDSIPANGATDVLRETPLSWTGGTPARYDVYLGTSAADVAAATVANPLGVLVSSGQEASSFEPARPDLGQTYYWRVDSVTDDGTFKGRIWNFTTEPFSYPMAAASITATASSMASDAMGPGKVVDGSGLNAADLHSARSEDMWLTAMGDMQPWIQFAFDKTYSLDKMVVWNSNQLIEPLLALGVKDVTVEVSTDGQAWTAQGDYVFTQADGMEGHPADFTVDFAGIPVKSVRLTIKNNWGGGIPQYGLSEVRFLWIPKSAREPNPANGATGVSAASNLSWRAGREASEHQVFLGVDAANLAKVDTTAVAGFTPQLAFNQTYFWKVVEVNAAETPSVWESDLWSFTTGSFLAIDDFETYTDDEGSRIYESWVDGVTDSKSGSTVGYMQAPFAETKIVHAGKQAMPLKYDNSASFSVSEAELAFDTPADWTAKQASAVTVWFRGQAPAFAQFANGDIVMTGIGTDISGTSDQFRYVYKTFTGDGSIVARVESLVNSNAWAKGGVMIRQSIEGGSMFAFMTVTPGGSSGGNGASFQYRLTNAGSAGNLDKTGAAVAAPYWVKVERKGNAMSGFISADGKAWTQIGTTQTITMTGPALIGFALSSHDAAVVTGAEFSNIATTGNVTGNWQMAEIGLTQVVGNSVEGLYLSVKDSAGKTKVVQCPDTAATAHMTWQQWTIPLSEFTSAGLKMNAVKSLVIGVGNKAAPVKGGTGTLFIDDIGFGIPLP
ncbi:MAG: discoidin domain-containing protein [Phycisphaerales bacterium]